MFKKMIAFSFFAVLGLLVPAGANAQPQPLDLRVQVVGPSAAMVKAPYVYTVRTRNIGGQAAAGVKVVVDLPLTDTSPTKHILGKLSGIDTTRCQVVSNKLSCNLQGLNPNQQKSFSFTFELPVSSKTLSFAPNATTTTPGEVNLGNNTLTYTPPITYPNLPITSGNVLVSLCTGRGLTSYNECELYPSSIQQFNATLNGDHTMTLPEPGYTAQWDQLISPQRLHWVISDGSFSAEFNGFASSSTCFEGITVFTPDNGYVSPYKVCLQ